MNNGVLVQSQNPLIVSNGLIGYWNFNDGSVTTIKDSSGKNSTGTATGPPQIGNGIVGRALNFLGSTYIVIPNNVTLNNWVEQSISLWFRVVGAMVQYTRIIEKGANNEWTIGMNDLSNNYKVWVAQIGSSPPTIISTNAFNDGIWHHLVVTISATYNPVIMYIDGILDKSQNAAGSPSKTGNINISQYGGGGGYNFNGLLDEIRIYNRVINAGEVKQLYLARGT